jgi:hypothetical protein
MRRGWPRWTLGGDGRPRRISDDGVAVIVAAAGTRPERLGLPFTHWSLRKLAAYSAGQGRPARIGRERLRQILHAHGISFQRTRTWKESADPGRQAGPDRVRDQSLPGSLLRLRPVRAAVHPARPQPRLGGTRTAGPAARDLPRTHGVRYFHGYYSVGGDQLWAGGRTGGHGVIGAQTGGRAPAGRPGQRPGTSRARSDRWAVTVIACNLGGARSTCMMRHVSSRRQRLRRSLAADLGARLSWRQELGRPGICRRS